MVGLFIATIALAGCAGSAADAPPLAGGPVGEAPVGPAPVSDSQGAVTGVVVDSGFNPVAEVDVRLFVLSQPKSPLATMRTIEDGAFQVGPLEPGSYSVVATRDGFGAASQFLEVFAGETSHANLQLTDLPTKNPYVEVLPFTGMMRCGFSAIVYSDNCGAVTEVQGETKISKSYNISAGFQTIVIETTWPYGDETMDNWLRWQEVGKNDTWFLSGKVGTPVLRNLLWPMQKAVGVVPSPTLVPRDLPDSDTPFVLNIATFYDGKLQGEANSTMPKEGCFVMGYCAGVGLALDFRFEQWVSIFMHAAPPDASEYSVIPDA